jgi:hypothetical protein
MNTEFQYSHNIGLINDNPQAEVVPQKEEIVSSLEETRKEHLDGVEFGQKNQLNENVENGVDIIVNKKSETKNDNEDKENEDKENEEPKTNKEVNTYEKRKKVRQPKRTKETKLNVEVNLDETPQQKLQKVLDDCKSNHSFCCKSVRPWWIVSLKGAAEFHTVINKKAGIMFRPGCYARVNHKTCLIITIRYFFDGKRDRLQACVVETLRSLENPSLQELGDLDPYHKIPEEISDEQKEQALANLLAKEKYKDKNEKGQDNKRKRESEPVSPSKKGKQSPKVISTSNISSTKSSHSLVPSPQTSSSEEKGLLSHVSSLEKQLQLLQQQQQQQQQHQFPSSPPQSQQQQQHQQLLQQYQFPPSPPQSQQQQQQPSILSSQQEISLQNPHCQLLIQQLQQQLQQTSFSVQQPQIQQLLQLPQQPNVTSLQHAMSYPYQSQLAQVPLIQQLLNYLQSPSQPQQSLLQQLLHLTSAIQQPPQQYQNLGFSSLPFTNLFR